MQVRIKILTLFFLVFFFILVYRLFFWQILRSKSLAQEARSQYETKKFVSAPRGNILASDGSLLVARGEAYLAFAEIPQIKKSPQEIANLLAPFFVEEKDDRQSLLEEIDRITGLLSRKETVWVPLKQKVSTDLKKNIEALKIEGLGFERKEDRIYPEASAAAHLLGFVGKNKEGDDVGYFGLEGYYDLSLAGKPGYASQENDLLGKPILTGQVKEISVISGVNLLTFLDKTVQMVLDKRLLEGIQKYGAKAGTAIVMDPKTGSIIGMSSYPSYDPVKYSQFSDELFKNPAISSVFEPGSVFKVVVMASALDAKVVEADTICDICSGPLKVDKYFIETWDKKYNPDSTMLEVIVHSDNVGMAFVGQKMGSDLLYDYLDRFGIGKPTGIDLQGEVSPSLRKKGNWNIVDLATAGFGQGIALTPIQLIRAVGAIANKGIMVSPRVVDKLMGENWEENIKPKSGQRVISEKAANEITAMMVEAARKGEAKWTALRGFDVAGKTGTAQIPIAGHYDADKTMASFIGFAPSDKPKFVMLITLREPSTSPWASETAAPLWYAIAKDLFSYFGIGPK
jgi:cell division protein FtsI/penicillin-binding protein 2